MLQPKLPPTQSNSTEIVGGGSSPHSSMENVFTLPPPALQSATAHNISSVQYGSAVAEQLPIAQNMQNKQAGHGAQRKRTLSGSRKPNPEPLPQPSQGTSAALPPPPSRTRKIIQMKPKRTSSATGEGHPVSSGHPTTSSTDRATASVNIPTSRRKQAQPSTTSATGRKIARKTAHSIIERRRRSKMNEEFSILKDMVPACAGVEMHKLAILQAGIEYVNYLEGCVKKLQAQNRSLVEKSYSGEVQEEDGSGTDEMMKIDQHGQHARTYTVSSPDCSESDNTYPSTVAIASTAQYEQNRLESGRAPLVVRPTTSDDVSSNLQDVQATSSPSTDGVYQEAESQSWPSISANDRRLVHSTSPPPAVIQTPLQTGVSPAFGAFRFSPDLTRSSAWSIVNEHSMSSKPSPNLLPLPFTAAPLPLPSLATSYVDGGQDMYPQRMENDEGQAEATATAALLMMTTDRRATENTQRPSTNKAMSVKDLLSS